MRSPFAPLIPALAALIASLVRWWIQGSGNLYTALDKRFYVDDPDFGWRISDVHPVWLGLEVCGVIAAIVLGLAVGGLVIRRRERGRLVRGAAWVVGIVPLAVPLLAFASGWGPAGARDVLPNMAGGATVAGIAGSLAAPAGRYEVVAHEGSVITAQITAGGETFDARFATVTGTWDGDPRDLARPMVAEASALAAGVETGVGKRSKHARQYLDVEHHPQITFRLDRILAASQPAPDRIAFRARGTLELIGRPQAIDVTGTLRKPEAAALARLSLSGDVLLVQADFTIKIAETALAADAADFDTEAIPVHVSLVLRR